MLRWRNALLIVMCAALCFGGSFTCFFHSGDGSFHEHPTTNGK